jgi:molybdenum cofactor cytidylyltransferase
MPYPDIVAVILASGRGERFGQPKAEATIEGVRFLERIGNILRQAGVERVIAAQGLDTPDMLSTLRVTVQNLSHSEVAGYLVWPVDHPFVLPDTVRSLCAAFRAAPENVVRPLHQGRSGHPIFIPVRLDLNRDDAGQGLAGLIRSQACAVLDLPVDDPGVLRNINHPADLED